MQSDDLHNFYWKHHADNIIATFVFKIPFDECLYLKPKTIKLKFKWHHLKGQRSYPFCHAKLKFNVLGGWVGKNIFIMTFCVTKWFKRKSHFKRKHIVNKVCTSVFHLITVLEGFLHSAFVTSPQKKALTSHF